MIDARQEQLELADGTTLHVRQSGDGTPVVLIHGTGGCAWLDSPGRLASRHRVIEYDRRGFGQSSPIPAAGYLDAQIADAAALIERLRLDRPVLVGHSWGGIVALGVAARTPDAVGRLVLMEPPLHVKKRPTPSFLLTFLKVQLLRRTRGAQAAAVAFLRYVTTRTDGPTTFDRLPGAARAELLRNASGTLAELDAGTGEELTRDAVAAIPHPVLIIRGACSRPVFQKAADRLALLLPQAQTRVLPAAGHMMHADQPTEFEAAVLDVAG